MRSVILHPSIKESQHYLPTHTFCPTSICFLSMYNHAHATMNPMQQFHSKRDTAQMDLSVLLCLGPDFDQQTVARLLDERSYTESNSIPAMASVSSPAEKRSVDTPRAALNELESHMFASLVNKRSFSDLSNRVSMGRASLESQQSPHLKYSSSAQSVTAGPSGRLAPCTPPLSTVTPTLEATERALEIALLLKEHPDCSCVLVTLIQEYQSRFQKALHVSELYTMKHVIDIQDFGGKRVARLLPTFRTRFDEQHLHTHLEQPFCLRHCPKMFIVNPDLDLPFVQMPFSSFAENVRQLLIEHRGSMPLASFPQCYAYSFEPLLDHQQGVPLEHYISCIKDIQIVTGQGVIKKVQLTHSSLGTCVPPSSLDTSTMHVDTCAEVQQRLQQFARDVIDLLKSQGHHCRLPVSKFVSAYHQYFNRQCRVADYGFSKVIDLLLSIPKSLQILGDGNRRIMTITHRCQMKRFTNEIIRLLKNKRQRSMLIKEISTEYEVAYKKPFCVADFGMCYLEDLVYEIKDNKELVVDIENGLIKLYRKERTDLEIYATSNFEKDVIDMLRLLPNFSIPFQKFIPSYHHHFGYQCKVQAYGFARLIDLLEELSTIVQIVDDKNGEKMVQLTTEMVAHAISLNIEQLVRRAPLRLKLKDLPMEYLQVYRHELHPEEMGVATIEELLLTMTDRFDFHYLDTDIILATKEPSPSSSQLMKNVIRTLMSSQCRSSFWQLKQDMLSLYQQDLSLHMCRQQLRDYVQVIDQTVRLTPPMIFAYHIVVLLSSSNGWMIYDEFLAEYQRRTKSSHLLYPTDYGFPTMSRLFEAIRLVVQVRGHMLVINPEFQSLPLKQPSLL